MSGDTDSLVASHFRVEDPAGWKWSLSGIGREEQSSQGYLCVICRPDNVRLVRNSEEWSYEAAKVRSRSIGTEIRFKIWWRRGELNSLPKPASQRYHERHLCTISRCRSMPRSRDLSSSSIFFSEASYEQKVTKRFGFASRTSKLSD